MPIYCVGETLEQREAARTFEVVERQLREGLEGVDRKAAERLVAAYEPVWAIGTGRTATAAQAAEAHTWIRTRLGRHLSVAEAVRIIYGGSVKPDNVDELMRQTNVNGCWSATPALTSIRSAGSSDSDSASLHRS